MAKTGYLVANQGFSTMYEGEPVFIQKGEFVPADHDFVKGREELFDEATHFGRFDAPAPPAPDEPELEPDDGEVEQATAGPGEKRGKKKT
jgi:hypothetical protein